MVGPLDAFQITRRCSRIDSQSWCGQRVATSQLLIWFVVLHIVVDVILQFQLVLQLESKLESFQWQFTIQLPVESHQRQAAGPAQEQSVG